MRVSLKLIISLLLILFIVACLFASWQAYQEKLLLAEEEAIEESYVEARLREIWINSMLVFAVQAFFVSLAAYLFLRFNVFNPSRKTAEWVKRMRRGEATEKLSLDSRSPFGSVGDEVYKLAKSLETARLSAKEEARLRQLSESVWTPQRLKEFVRMKLDGRPLFVVSNREPYMHVRHGKQVECVIPASGLVTAIEPVLKACGGTWIAQAAGDADRETVGPHDKLRVPPEEPQYLLRRVWITSEEEKGYYYGFANEGLWPLCHLAHTRPVFRQQDWTQYETVNRIFAKATLQELQGTVEPFILVQDYHFALLPKMIKAERPDSRISVFWHIPWPNPESFGICPWQRELLEGLLAADIVSFHTQHHCNNFMESCDRFLESRLDYEHSTVNREGQATWIRAYPISIDFAENGSAEDRGGPPSDRKESIVKQHGINAEFIGVGVDRLDYTKGILERFRSIEHFLEKNPRYQGRFTFVELGAPSRVLIPKYQEFVTEIEREAERINGRFKSRVENWKPIVLLLKHHSHRDIIPFYRLAHLCMVTSLHDGMNLVAKEYVMARNDEAGALILSQFTGASRELTDAFIVNPYDIGQMAEAIRQALEMTPSEQASKMRNMRNVLRERNVYRWAADLVGELAQVRLPRVES